MLSVLQDHTESTDGSKAHGLSNCNIIKTLTLINLFFLVVLELLKHANEQLPQNGVKVSYCAHVTEYLTVMYQVPLSRNYVQEKKKSHRYNIKANTL